VSRLLFACIEVRVAGVLAHGSITVAAVCYASCRRAFRTPASARSACHAR
jgi:hypothetical protein